MKNCYSKILIILEGMFVAISSMFLSFYLIVGEYDKTNISITLIASFICSILVFWKTNKEVSKNIKKEPILTIILGVSAIIIIKSLFDGKGLNLQNRYLFHGIDPFRFRFFCIAMFSAIYYIIFLGFRIKKWITNFWKKLDKWDKKAYVITSLLFTLLIMVFYLQNNKYFSVNDAVYSMDTDWVFKIFNRVNYYDIRHPLMSVFVFPIGAVTKFLANHLVSHNLVNLMQAIFIQVINANLLVLIGLQLKKLTKSKMVYIMYILSFSTLINVVFLEKYNLCAFLLVLYVYTLCIENKTSIFSLISAVGALPINVCIGICEIVRKNNLNEKVKQITKIIFIAILAFLALGRAHVFINGIEEAKTMQQAFSVKELSMLEKSNCTFNMLESSIISLPSSVNASNQYMWNNIDKNVSIIAYVLFALAIIGVIKNHKELFIKIFTIWIGFAFILFLLLNWSTDTAPLFTPLFSWAFIPLVVLGLEEVIKKFHLNKKVVYGILLFIICLTNILVINNINTFLLFH